MQRPVIQRALLLVVVALATALRVYQLKDLPAGFFCDEAGLGYNAYTIASAGTDEAGHRFPLFFWSFGVSYKNPIFVYAAALPVKLLGLDEFSVRLTSAVFGVGTVIGIFFLGRALFSGWVGLFAAILLAVCPWHLHFSRIAFELISFPFLFVIGMTFLVHFTQGRRTLAAAMVFFALCFYAYQPANLFVPLFLVGFMLLYLPLLLRRWGESVVALAVVLATAAPAAIFHYTHQPQSTQYFRGMTWVRLDDDLREQAEWFGQFYRQFFSREFLFERGDRILRHAVRTSGELLPFYAPFLLVGAAVCLFRRDRASKLILWWLAVYPVAPTLMNEIPSASRGIIGAPAFCLLAGIGFGTAMYIVGWIGHWRPVSLALQLATLAAAGYVLLPEVQRYLTAYFSDYPKYSAPGYEGFQYGYRDVIAYMEPQRWRYDQLLISAVEGNQTQIFPLFYNRVLPQDAAGHDGGYVIIDPARYRSTTKQRVLAALRRSDLQLFSDYTIQRPIVAPGGQEEFVITEVRARKDDDR
jgi:4-amino-4-deoxy-L-arabinose transferase-like glycosyltransferase